MEEELRKMPEIFKEIKPVDYTPDKSIIPTTAPPPKVSEEHPTGPVMTLDKDDSIKIDLVEGPDIIDPYKGTKDTVKIKDPFGPNAQPSPEKKKKELKEDKLHCYACGTPIGEKDTTCSKCGAEL